MHQYSELRCTTLLAQQKSISKIRWTINSNLDLILTAAILKYDASDPVTYSICYVISWTNLRDNSCGSDVTAEPVKLDLWPLRLPVSVTFSHQKLHSTSLATWNFAIKRPHAVKPSKILVYDIFFITLPSFFEKNFNINVIFMLFLWESIWIINV